jgi:hypothetical protein
VRGQEHGNNLRGGPDRDQNQPEYDKVAMGVGLIIFWPALLRRHAYVGFDNSFDERVFRQVFVVLTYDRFGLL